MRGSNYTCRYLIISTELHRPTSFIISVSTPDQKRAMAPAARRECMDAYLEVKPRLELGKRIASFSILLMSSGVLLT